MAANILNTLCYRGPTQAAGLIWCRQLRPLEISKWLKLWYLEIYQADETIKDGYARLSQFKHATGDYHEAMSLLHKDYQQGRLSRNKQYYWAILLSEHGDFKRAEDLMDRLYQEDGRVLNGFAKIAYRMMAAPVKQWAEAERLLIKDLNANRLASAHRFRLAIVKAAQGNWNEAENAVEQMYHEDSAAADSYAHLGHFGFLLGRGSDYFKTMLDRDSTLKRCGLEGKKCQSLYLAATGFFDDAVQTAEEFLRNKPDKKDVFTELGWLWLKHGNPLSGSQLMRRDFDNKRMSPTWYAAYAVALSTVGLKQGVQNIMLAMAVQNSNDLDDIQIGNPLAPDAVMRCSHFKSFLNQGLGYDELQKYMAV